ncbi:MAG: type II toxin-antitoxin system HicB family antitoxin [Nitrospinae bacterium]|nr:type II toxin-antitoxin system HicB family antitoxin [Nitrospinota bacterium]MBL7019360.1 type II toxin-antitoxin system HicB family antitoxin [Nitrospinaceae bacterium]
MDKYPFQIRELSKADGDGYLVTFPDLPGCMGDGETVNEAMKNAYEAAAAWIKARKKWGKEIPVPTPPIDYGDFSGKFVQRVPKSVHAQLARRAEQEGISMNQLVTSFIVAGLQAGTWSFATNDMLYLCDNDEPLTANSIRLVGTTESEKLHFLETGLADLIWKTYGVKVKTDPEGKHCFALGEGEDSKDQPKKKV